jgi:hypothetical protein
MTPTRKCEMRPPCCWAGDVKSAIIQRSGRPSSVPLASGTLGVALGLRQSAALANMPGCLAACGVEAFLQHVQVCRVTTSYGPSMRRQLCRSQREYYGAKTRGA